MLRLNAQTRLANSLLLVITVVALLTGGFGTTPTDLFNSLLDIFGGDRLHNLTIVPAHMLNAILTLGLGLYLIRSVRRWLDNEFLPKTGMGAGMRASLLTLFVNLGYVLIALLTLPVLGVRWANRVDRQRAIGRHRLRVAGNREKFHLGADPVDRASGQGRGHGRYQRRRGRHPAHQRARDRNTTG
ncbi:hypothetical protein HDG33_000686 [Paraburkholderia sp. Cpub6]|nr:hypothetical protein [Paraburkholderia sp. Cpub6]